MAGAVDGVDVLGDAEVEDREARFRNADEVLGFLSRKFEQPLLHPDKTQPLH